MEAPHWWKKSRPVRNADLWIELDGLVGVHKTNWLWTKGHAGHEDNNRCDWLAQNAARTQTSSWPTAGRMGAFVSTWAAIMFLRIRRPVCSTLSILGMTLKMRATQASGAPIPPHVEQAQPRQPRLLQQAALQYGGAPAPVSHAGFGLKLEEDSAKAPRLR